LTRSNHHDFHACVLIADDPAAFQFARPVFAHTGWNGPLAQAIPASVLESNRNLTKPMLRFRRHCFGETAKQRRQHRNIG
jgi:hypothetical protein